ncbi:MAG: 3-hydroxylacyl-ACP dehydratase [Burkholderiales bacterium]|nr:3-hydroxylacyl-ACP dehydratase [Burkholderiales bacterium]
MLDQKWIAAHIPHQGRMCLLDAVLSWTDQHVVCESNRHADPDHPLRAADRLGAATGVEYAAQAMAIHGALLAPTNVRPGPGYLTSVRGLKLYVDRLDDLEGALTVTAQRLSGDERLIIYQIQLHHRDRCLLDGRASVALNVVI